MKNYQSILSKFHDDNIISCSDQIWICASEYSNSIDDLVEKGFIRKYVNNDSLKTEYLMITDKGIDFLILISAESGFLG